MNVLILLKRRSEEMSYHLLAEQVLNDKIEQYRNKGKTVAGYTIVNNWNADDYRSDFAMKDLIGGEQRVYLSSETPSGDVEKMCGYYLERAVFPWMCERIRAASKADVFIFAKIGRLELEGTCNACIEETGVASSAPQSRAKRGNTFAPLLRELLQQGDERQLVLMTRAMYLKKLLKVLGLSEGQYSTEGIDLQDDCKYIAS